MILSGKTIKKLLDDKIIVVSPPAEVKEASIKIHFSDSFGKNRNELKPIKEYILKPKEFVVCLTKENITLPDNYAGLYDTHISLSSVGVITHMGSMLIEPGFSGQILLEIFNASDTDVILNKDARANPAAAGFF
ncbi:MAG: Deoxycytidine triphosphate deaminase [Microgenomates group bacterium GW2011_GWA2_40_6]|nr:MAG: Deoxycytidine triphosphate deaminase [Microgenomates group bacterium GW2011_GWA2_40_6]